MLQVKYAEEAMFWREKQDSWRMIKEYRICMPLTVEEVRAFKQQISSNLR